MRIEEAMRWESSREDAHAVTKEKRKKETMLVLKINFELF